MSLDTFHPNLLKLMHFLVQNQKFMNSVEISKNFSHCGKTFTDRNIRNWFKFLKKNDFWYYPYMRAESFGLMPVFMTINGLRDDRILSCTPYLTYAMHGFNIRTFQKNVVTKYMIPPDKLEKFQELWELSKSKGLISDFKIFPIKTPVTLFSPFHNVVSKDGKFDFSSITDEDLDYFIDLLNSRINEYPKIEVNKSIHSNPLILPIAMEYYKGHPSSKKAWFNMKEKFGDKIWDYTNVAPHKRTDGTGVKQIQTTLRHLHNNFFDFFSQIRIDYIPFYREDSIVLFLFLKINDKNRVPVFARDILKTSHHAVTCLPLSRKSNNYIFFITTNKSGVENILSNIMPNYIDAKSESTVIWRNFEESYKNWNKYESSDKIFLREKYLHLFDPKKATWSYSHDDYVDKLNFLHQNLEKGE